MEWLRKQQIFEGFTALENELEKSSVKAMPGQERNCVPEESTIQHLGRLTFQLNVGHAQSVGNTTIGFLCSKYSPASSVCQKAAPKSLLTQSLEQTPAPSRKRRRSRLQCSRAVPKACRCPRDPDLGRYFKRAKTGMRAGSSSYHPPMPSGRRQRRFR